MNHMKSVLPVFCVLIIFKGFALEVKVKQGTLKGIKKYTVFDSKPYFAFYGVPYAKAPVGSRRFKDPEPLKKWKNVIDARSEDHTACTQAHIVHKHAIFGSENCLFMNIFTPSFKEAWTESKSVLLFVHGHAFTSSFSHLYGPDFFIENDVIFVSVSYRIGVFGFLKLNESDSHSNMGLKDIVMALKWVKKNIQYFNGDSKKVSVMGTDSAATFLSLLLMTSKKNLFSRMILQSGTVYSPSFFSDQKNFETAKLTEELRKKGYQKIIDAPALDIISSCNKIYSSTAIINSQRHLIPFLPSVELKSNFYKRFFTNNISIIVGFTKQEGLTEVVPFFLKPSLLDTFTTFSKFIVPFSGDCFYNYNSREYKEIGNKIKHRYFSDNKKEKKYEGLLKYIDEIRTYPIYHFIKTLKQIKKDNVFVYKFNYVGKFNAVKSTIMSASNIRIKGATSGDELCYLMNCEPLRETYMKLNKTDRDFIFIRKITRLWTDFVKTSNPTPQTKSLDVTWLPNKPDEDNILFLGKEIKLIKPNKEENMFKFWNNILNDYYSSEKCNKRSHHQEL